MNYDPECAQVPYQKVFRIHFRVSMAGEPRNIVNSQVYFDVVIGNVCEDDRITFSSQVPSTTYIIRHTPALVSENPIIV